MPDQKILEQRLHEHVAFFCSSQDKLADVAHRFISTMKKKHISLTVFTKNDKSGVISDTFTHTFHFDGNQIIGENTESFFLEKSRHGTVLKFLISDSVAICFVVSVNDMHNENKTMDLHCTILSTYVEKNKTKICEILIPEPAPQQ